jgi:hypothetical protein
LLFSPIRREPGHEKLWLHAEDIMSLTGFLNMPDVKAKLKPLHPKLPRKIAATLKVEPKSNRFAMLGTAFDYLLRFELQRQAPHAMADRWVAEYVPDKIWRPGCYLHLSKNEKRVVTVATGLDAGILTAKPPWELEELAKEVAGRMRAVVEKAKSSFATYLKTSSPARREKEELAAHAIRLAKLDPMYRSHRLDPTFEEVNLEDVEDLHALLAIVPFNALIHPQIMLLNPRFKQTSGLLGGADTDLITGDMLVDFKTTISSELQARNLDQLFGYYLLARHQRQFNPTFPQIKQMAIYFCRHGHLWIVDATTWTAHPQFAEVEEWFFKRAKEVFGTPKIA